MLDLCVAQAMGAPFYGHATFRRPYLVLMLDRGADSHTRTMRRLGFRPDQVPIKFLKAAVDGEASQQVIDMIEQTNPTPQVVFIEGIDMLVSDPNSLDVVMPFMHEIQQIASHFHIAIVGSCGAPKTKPKDGYAAKRDTIFGSAVWSRMSETIVTIQYPAGDDTANQREIAILARNAKAEQFTTEFQDGRLVAIQPVANVEMNVGGRPNESLQTAIDFLERELQNGPRPSDNLIRDAREFEDIKRPVLFKAAKTLGINMRDRIAGKAVWSMPVMEAMTSVDRPEETTNSTEFSFE